MTISALSADSVNPAFRCLDLAHLDTCEVLDPEQNGTFHDNYLDLDYDLSHVLFITTANDISTIQPALLDRMELINVTGYLAEEKMEIAKKFLVPKELKEHGIDKKEHTVKKLKPKTIVVYGAAPESVFDKYRQAGIETLTLLATGGERK